jgi:hypothetical protein
MVLVYFAEIDDRGKLTLGRVAVYAVYSVATAAAE